MDSKHIFSVNQSPFIRSGSNLTLVNQSPTTRLLGSKYVFIGQSELNDSVGLESFLSQSEPDILITVVVRYMADRLYGGLRIWRTFFAVFGCFLTFFGDF